MIKATQISLGLAALLVLPANVFAQTNDSAIGMAVNQSVINQADTIMLRQKLVEAQNAAQSGDILDAARLYQDCVSLAQKIGPGIPNETAQAIAGLSNASMILARDAQSRGDYREANVRVTQVLNADPKNPAAIAFKKHNDELLAANRGLMPSDAIQQQMPAIIAQKVDAETLVQDGKLLYEMGKLEDAAVKLNAALKLDPDNKAATYYLNLIGDAAVRRNIAKHSLDAHVRMNEVEKAWTPPTTHLQLPTPNAYATNNLIYTGSGRQTIIDKLNRIHLDNVAYDGLPLSEVLRQLTEQSKLRDPEHKGINFLINPNPDQSGQPVAGPAQTGNPGAPGGGFGGIGGDPTLPPGGVNTAAAGTVEKIDIGSVVTVKLNVNDVRLADLLEAIIQVADHPDGHQLKYSILEYGVVFADKGPETPLLVTRRFKVDPNTFYSGLDSVNAESFGSTSSSSGGGSGGGGGGGGGNSQNQSSSIVGVVDSVPGASQARQSGGQGGGGGGGGAQTSGSNPLDRGGTTGAGQASGQGGGLRYVTKVSLSADVSMAARNFFTTLGVNLQSPPGKSVFFNDRLGVLFVKATQEDLDTIDQAIQALNQIAPQVHIKARFIEVQEANMNALGFQWYLGQFNIGQGVVGQGGSSGSLTTPVTSANPLGTFPGNTAASQVAGSANDQLVTSGLRNALGAPAIGTITGILTNPNFQVALQALEQRTGTEELAEPEVVTTSGRQTQMRATSILTIITSFTFQQGTAASTTSTTQ